MKIFGNVVYISFILAIVFNLVYSGSVSVIEETTLQERVNTFLKPYRTNIQRWFWKVSGVTYNNPFAMESRAAFLDCEVCIQAIPFVRGVLNTGISDTLLTEVIVTACLVLDLAPERRICRPIVEKYIKPASYMFRYKPDIENDDFCGIINPGCSPVSDTLTNWTIRVNNDKPVAKPRPLPPSADTALSKILHFTDIHLDLHYTPGKNIDCSLPACCRIESGDPITNNTGAKNYGALGCALPTRALKAIYQHAKTNHHDARFIFLTGDYIHSNTWEYSQTENGMHIGNVSLWLKEIFEDTSAEIYPLIGNHEPDICNLYPPEDAWGNFSLTWMYDAVAEPYKDFIPTEQLNLFRKYGYYSVESKRDTKLRIIVLNSNMCYIDNFWLPFDSIDPFGQLQWFSDTMHLAEQLGQMVFIIGHISPGSFDCFPVWSHQFNRVINRYEALIKGQWYGHEHDQNYKVTFEDVTGRPISVSYVDGSGLPDGMNSAYNVFYADGERGDESTWEIVNHETWILNLTASNANPDNQSPVFQKILDAKIDYKLNNMSPEAVHNFINRMVCDDDLFLKYQKVNIKGEDSPRFTPCGNDKSCKAMALKNLFVANTADISHRDKLENLIISGDCFATGHLNVPSSILSWMIILIAHILHLAL